MLRHLHRVSSILRGEQMAAYMLNARLNPESGYENDVTIYVKPHIKQGQDYEFIGHAYLDLVDGFGLIDVLERNPWLPAIVFSDMDVETVSKLVKNRIVCIPHQHLNFERQKRERQGVRKVGVIGSEGAFKYIPEEIRRGLANRGIELVEHQIMFPRTLVVKFYMQVDVILVWSPYNAPDVPGLYNPFKIVNASSFGVPTIALDKPAFHEMDGCYFPVQNEDEFFEKIDALRSDQQLYDAMSKVCLEKSERYHISNIAKLYTDLCVPYK